MDLDTIDLDRLAQLLALAKDNGLLELRLGNLHVRYPAPEPVALTEHPLRPVVESPRVSVPNPYERAAGTQLPREWPKAE